MSSPATEPSTESVRAPGPVNASEPKGRRPRRSRVVGAAAVLVLVGVGIGVGIAWLMQDDADSRASYLAGNTVIAGSDLTERQLEMVEITGRYVDAWIEKNGDAVASFMAPGGSVHFPTLGDRTIRADDGTLQNWVESTGQIPNELNDPVIVEDNRVVLVGRGPGNLDWMMSIEFTSSGEVTIVSDTHWAWS